MSSNKRLSRRQRQQIEIDSENVYNKTMNSMKEIVPLTKTQDYLFGEWKKDHNIAAVGSAGTGKTYTATYLALKDVLEYNFYNKVIFFRSAVQSREQGFMPGTIQEKEAMYEEPFIAIVNNLFGRNDAYRTLKERDKINFKSTSFIRGLTYDNCIMILDEAQNCTYEELRTVYTRKGNNTKFILCGDSAQDDLKNSKNRQDVSGLFKFIKIFEETRRSSIVNFGHNDIVRSEDIKDFIIAEEKFLQNV